jgi:hypothetical protein
MWLRVFERIHGHLGWLSVAALLHPAILLRNPHRRARLAVVGATTLVVATGLLGGCIYPEYRERVKPGIVASFPALGVMFERKEHLAVGSVSFALVGCVMYLALPMFEDADVKRKAGRLAHGSFVVAVALAGIVASLGVAVASYASF